MNTQTAGLAEKIMQEDPEAYEQYLLVALNHDQELWTRVSAHLCIDASSKYKPNINDFSSVVHYGLYLALKQWREKMATGGCDFQPANDGAIGTTLYIMSQEPRAVLHEDQMFEYVDLWNTIMAKIDKDDALATVRNTWRNWLTNKKAEQIARNSLRGNNTAELLLGFQQQANAIQAEAEHNDFDTIEAILNAPDVKPVERFPMSPATWSLLNESLGGGFGRGEHTLIVAPTGGGKTVIACQIAAEMAYADRNVLFVSTEETLERVLPRFASLLSYHDRVKIPYQTVKYKPNFKDYLPPAQLEAVLANLRRVTSHMLYSNWTGNASNGSTRSYTIDELDGEVERAIKRFAREGKRLDMVILDWLGATLGELANGKLELREVYQMAATRMKDIAVKYDIATISLAQTSADGAKKVLINQDCIAENKSLHREAHAAIGISHIANKAGSTGDVQTTYQEEQCMNVFKSRGGVPKSFWIRENFDFMRFDRLR